MTSKPPFSERCYTALLNRRSCQRWTKKRRGCISARAASTEDL